MTDEEDTDESEEVDEPLAGLVDDVGEGDRSDEPNDGGWGAPADDPTAGRPQGPGESPTDAEGTPPGAGRRGGAPDGVDVVDEDGAGAADEPLGDIAGDIAERRRRHEGGDDEFFERAFEDVAVEEADTEALWEDLESGSLETPVEEADVEADESAYVVEKREYCQRCQYFSEPPDVSCGYEGSEIAEVEDTERFRVTGCPIVEGVEDLQRRD